MQNAARLGSDADPAAGHRSDQSAPPGPVLAPHEAARVLDLLDAQMLSRHTDLLTRELQKQGEAFYSIGSAGHESNAAVAMALRSTDPALLHYRSGGFYAGRSAQVPGSDAARDILAGTMSSTDDAISGGRHKVFGSTRLNIIPQTSTISSHLPRAFGLAFALGRLGGRHITSPWPSDAVVVCTFGDASLNHSTAQGAINTAAYCVHRGLKVPLLFVCEDNGIGISTRTPEGWVENRLRTIPGIEYVRADGEDPLSLLRATRDAAATVRQTKRPVMLHLKTVRFMGHAGSDAEIAYRSSREIEADYARDPILATARLLVQAGELTPEGVVERYEEMRAHVADRAASVARTRLSSSADVTAPITQRAELIADHFTGANVDAREEIFGATFPEFSGDLTLAQTINATLKDMLAKFPEAFVLGQDVARKGGVYGVTRGLFKTYGSKRVIDTVLDEQSILGTALGAALAGHLPVPEIQYLAYLHNAEDQLRGEAATLKFFSAGQYQNGMVVRVAGLAYQRGFGGHFHNDNSLAVLRDIPGVVVAVPSHPSAAPALIRECFAMAKAEGRVCVVVEPIALYHQRDIEDGDGAWQAPYAAPSEWPDDRSGALGSVRAVRESPSPEDLLIVTFGNGVRMSQRAANRLAQEGVEVEIIDLQWLAPLPVDALVERAAASARAQGGDGESSTSSDESQGTDATAASAPGGTRPVLVVDETRRSGGVSESVITALIEHGHRGPIRRVASADSFIPLGPAANEVLLSEDDIVEAAREMAGGR